MTGRAYTDVERARAVGLALAQGADRAAQSTGIPRRTISRWLGSPDAVVLRAETREQVAERLWSAVVEGTEAVAAGLRDPHAKLGDKASALRIVVEAHQLISGGATSRIETSTVDTGPHLTDEERTNFREFYDALVNAPDGELDTWLADGGLRQLRDSVTKAEAEDTP